MSRNVQAELKKAVALLGGSRRAGRLSGIGRTKLDYWCYVSMPEWRHGEAERVIALARIPKNQVEQSDTPAWALAKVKERRKDAVR